MHGDEKLPHALSTLTVSRCVYVTVGAAYMHGLRADVTICN